jgi:hypothetical protein
LEPQYHLQEQESQQHAANPTLCLHTNSALTYTWELLSSFIIFVSFFLAVVTDDESCPGRQRIASPAASTEFKLQTCDDKHRLARFLLLFRAERDELAEAPFFVLNFLVRGLVKVGNGSVLETGQS